MASPQCPQPEFPAQRTKLMGKPAGTRSLRTGKSVEYFKVKYGIYLNRYLLFEYRKATGNLHTRKGRKKIVGEGGREGLETEASERGKSRALSGLTKLCQGVKEILTNKRAPEYANEDGIWKENQQQAVAAGWRLKVT